MRGAIERIRANACHTRMLTVGDAALKQAELDALRAVAAEVAEVEAERRRLEKVLATPENQNAKLDAMKRMSRIMQSWLAGSLRGYLMNMKLGRLAYIEAQAEFAKMQALSSQGGRHPPCRKLSCNWLAARKLT